MKKFFCLLLCVLMVASLCAACGGDKGQTGGDGDVTLTIGLPKSVLVTDYYDNAYTKWLEEKTGYKLEFQFFASNQTDYKAQLSTMVAGKIKLPDILYSMSLGGDTYERYGKDGVFVDLSPYFNDKEKSAKWWERFEVLSEESQTNNWRRMQSSDGTGKIYAFPEIQESLIDIMKYQVWINREWMETLQLEYPTNPDELYNVLKAFKTQDPNGNGIADELPLVGTNGALSGHTLQWLINMFVYCDESVWFNVDENGKLYLPHTTDAYREAIKYIRKLYDEKLMSPLVMNSTSSDLQQMVCPPDGSPTLAGIAVCHLTLGFVQNHEGVLNYEALPLWGNAVLMEDQHYFTTFITRDCQNVDAAWNLLMWMSTEESAIIQRYGEEGVDWDWADEGATSVLGTPAQIKLYKDTWAAMGNNNWRNVDATILVNAEQEGNQALEDDSEINLHKYKLFNDMLNSYRAQAETYNPDEKLICPLLVWPEELKEELPYERGDCQQIITKFRSDFITGVKDPNNDAHWNEYLTELKNKGVEDWIYYSQYIYEETMAAKG